MNDTIWVLEYEAMNLTLPLRNGTTYFGRADLLLFGINEKKVSRKQGFITLSGNMITLCSIGKNPMAVIQNGNRRIMTPHHPYYLYEGDSFTLHHSENYNLIVKKKKMDLEETQMDEIGTSENVSGELLYKLLSNSTIIETHFKEVSFSQAPMCIHGLECSLKCVKKGAKEGKRYYVCPKSEDRCSFFQWENAPRCSGHKKYASLCESQKVASFGKLFWTCSEKIEPCNFFQWHKEVNDYHNYSTFATSNLNSNFGGKFPSKSLFDSFESRRHLFD